MRFYQPFSTGKTLLLDERNRHHLVNVMRCREKDICYVFDGTGKEVKTTISHITKKEVILEVLEVIENESESPLKIHLYQALCKGEKMDWIVQKAVELGVTDITPLITERCDVKLTHDRLEKKLEHWRNIIISATEQSGRAVLATLSKPLSLPEALQHNANYLRLLLTPQANNKFSLLATPTNKKIAIFIGPEGGFSDAEIVFAVAKDIQTVTLGKRILRTETAPLAAIASLQMLWGDF